MAPQSVVALRRCRSMLGCATVAALLMSSAATAAANHTGSGAAGDGHEVTSLVVQVAEASQELADLAAGIQQRQEDVNKALLQVGGTRAAAARAADAVVASQRALDDAGAQIVAAQRRFDHFAASTYLNGPSDGYVTATSPEDLIAAAAAGRTLEVASAQARDDLQRARTEQTNRQSAARAAQRDADTAAADAQHSLDAAVATLTAAHDDFTAQQATVTAVAARRDTAQAQLRAAQSHPVEQPAPTPAAASPSSPLWDRRTDPAPPNRGQWDTTLPMVPSANIAGDPVAVINAVLQLSATSAQATATMGRTFLVKLGILPAAAAAADPGLTNGRIPRVYGRQASEYVIRRAMSQIGVPYSWGGGSAAGPSRGIDGVTSRGVV